MKYDIQFKPQALKDCRRIAKSKLQQLFKAIEEMSDGLKGDVKRLTDFTPEFRLRVGDYRVLFATDNESITIYRIRHRKDAY